MSVLPRPGPDLARVQREFQRYVLQRDPAALQHVLAGDAAEAAVRMDIYADGYALRLLEALETDYPGLAALAASETFEALGRAYIAAHPSTFRNLRWFGGELAPFLESSSEWSQQPELADMARFEWAMAQSFDAPDAASLSREALASVSQDDWPRLSFRVHPAVQRVELTTNAPQVWSAQNRGEPLPPLSHGPARVWLLTRREFQVRFRSMSADEATAFGRLATGIGFAQWCGELGDLAGQEHAAEQAIGWLNQWLADGALAGFALGAADY
jgi:hypothetical protein